MTEPIETAETKYASLVEKKKEVLTVTEGKGLYNIVDDKQKIISIKKGEL